VQAVRQAFGAKEKTLDYADHPNDAVRTINTSVSKATHGKIPRLFNNLDPATVLVLTNAVYLKAKWALPFDRAMTAPATFHLPAGSISKPRTMELRGQLRYAHRDGYQVVQLPYRGGRLAMSIILPDGQVGGLETQLQQRGLSGLTAGLRATDL